MNTTTKIINMYEFFQQTDDKLQEIIPKEKNSTWSYESIAGTNDVRVRNELGEKIEYHVYNPDGRQKFINYFNKFGKKIRREWYDANGYMSKVEVLHPTTEKLIMEQYFCKNGTPCIYKYFSGDDKPQLTDIHLVKPDGRTYFTCHTEQELITYWLKQLFDEESVHYCFIDRSLPYYPILKNWQRPNLKIISLFHSSHLKTGNDYMTGQWNSNYRDVLNDIDRPDAVVYLTEKQRHHVKERLGHHDNQYVIPHALETLPARVPFSQRTPYSVAYLARFADEKQPLAAIRIFHQVLQEFPTATFHLYGRGDQRDKMLGLIRELNASNNIFIHDFVDSVEAIYNRTQIGILTSKVEGFSLFTLECIAHGVPVISYDIDYGPSDMITSGENGVLCPLDDEEMMANALITLFENQAILEQMSHNAYEAAKRFDGAKVAHDWKALLQNLES
ncbi:glycosyltransferase [Kurthia populi]